VTDPPAQAAPGEVQDLLANLSDSDIWQALRAELRDAAAVLSPVLQAFGWVECGDLTVLRRNVATRKGLTVAVMARWLISALKEHVGGPLKTPDYFKCEEFAKLATAAVCKLAVVANAK
jgi:hypothetical protein